MSACGGPVPGIDCPVAVSGVDFQLVKGQYGFSFMGGKVAAKSEGDEVIFLAGEAVTGTSAMSDWRIRVADSSGREDGPTMTMGDNATSEAWVFEVAKNARGLTLHLPDGQNICQMDRRFR